MTPDLIAGRYRVIRAVGRGGMGTVWLCHDEVLGREVAVKQIGMLPGESAPDAARALREARSSAALNHRNVVSVFDVVDPGDGDGGHAWLVMEYVPSRTLAETVRDDGPLPPRRAARIGAQVADGLAAAHAVGTIHRDVKPGNILVGEDDLAKISDFGIARRADDDQLTRTGLVTGTPSYFSPELARGEDPGPESDVYALGSTLYYAVEGHAPYPEHRNPIALLQTIAAEDPAPVTRAGPLTGPIARMMERDPRSRWTMSEAVSALQRVSRGESPADDEHTAVFAAPTAATAVALAGAPGPGLAGPTGGGRPPYDAPHDADRDDRRRGRMAPWLAAAAVLLLVVLGAGYLAWDDGTDPEPQAGPTASDAPSESESGRPRPQRATPTPSPTPTPTPTPEEEDAADGDPVDVVQEYFAVMPGDPDAGWSRLAPSMQEQGRAAYESFWSTIDAVQLHSARPAGEEQVQIDLTYFFDDGEARRETQLVTMEQSDSGYLIADDEVLSSRTAS